MINLFKQLFISCIFFLLFYHANSQCVGTINYTDTCFTNVTQFHARITGGALVGDSTLWKWNFGDPSSGKKDSAIGASPFHLYSSQGIYNVRLIFPCGGTNDTIYQNVTITNPLVLTVTLKDSLVCDTPYVLNAGVAASSYLWSNGATTKTNTISSAGHYWVKAYQNGCYATDTANIRFWGKGNKGDYNWFFGDKAGLNFKGNPPTAISGKDSTYGGSSVISDPSGKLLFYTDGKNIYTKDNTIMQGGTGLLGEDSLQSTIIIPDPRANNIYYVFTSSPSTGLNYSVVDLSFNNGVGEVTNLNVPLATPSNELVTGQIAGTKDSTGKNFWLVTHGLNNNEFIAYSIGNAGLNENFVTSDVGSPVNSKGGNIKFSTDGNMAAMTIPDQNKVELFTFDKVTGQFKLKDTITNLVNPYDIAFSDDNSKLYVSTDGNGHLYQYNLAAANDSLIMASQTTIGNNPGSGIYGLQSAPDNKIYVSIPGSNSIGVINEPDLDGTSADFQQAGVSLLGTAMAGLTNFVANYFTTPNWAIQAADTCFGMTTQFEATAPDTITSWVWNFQDGSTATGQSVTHTFSHAGTFQVSVEAKYSNCIDTILKKTVTILQTPTVSLHDTTLCQAQRFPLDATFPGASYLWSTGATTPVITTDTSGLFQVQVSIGGCAVIGQANVTFSPVNTFNLGSDKTLCLGDSVKLIVSNNPGLSTLWSTGAISQSIVVKNPGNYSVTVSNGPKCSLSDNINVSFITPPSVSLGNSNQIVCPNNPGFSNPILDAGNFPGFSYLWTTGETTEQIEVKASGTYGVKVYKDNCASGDTIAVTFDKGPSVSLPPEENFCSQFGDTLVLDGGIAAHYTWLPGGETTQQLVVKSAGTFTLIASDINNCQAATISTTVLDICEAQIFIPTIFTPDGDGLNDQFKISGNNITNYDLEIFNRWGELIFVSKDINTSWDGNYKGQLVEEGVYVWKIQYSGDTVNGIISNKKAGDVTVLRSKK